MNRVMVYKNIWAQQIAQKLVQRNVPFSISAPVSGWYTFEVHPAHSQDLNEVRITVPADCIN